MAKERPNGKIIDSYSLGVASGTAGQGTVQGVSALTYFGPLQPIVPAVPPEQAEAMGVNARLFDYPVGYNLRITPRQEEETSFQELRDLADALDILRLVIETRKDQMAKMQWGIFAKEGKIVADSKLETLNTFWQTPDQQNCWDEWLRALLEDMFVIDAATVYPRKNKGGGIYGFELIDGATVLPRINAQGRTPAPPSVAYSQVMKGMSVIDYTADELIYRPRNIRTNHVFGFSQVEQVRMTINISLRRQLRVLSEFTDGTTPVALISCPKEWDMNQIRDAQLYIDTVLEGNIAERRHMKMIPDGSRYIPTKEPLLKNEFDEWLARIICFCFSLPPTAFIKQLNRAGAEQQQETATQEGLFPSMQWVKNLVNICLWKYQKETDCEFRWEQQVDVDPLVQAQIDKIYGPVEGGGIGAQTAQQIAEARGLDWDESADLERKQVALEASQGNKIAETDTHKEEPGQAEKGQGKPSEKVSVEKLAKKAKVKYKINKQVDFNRPSVERAHKALTNRMTTFLKKQRKDVSSQLVKAIGSRIEKLAKGDVPSEEEVQAIIDEINLQGWAIVPEEFQPFLQRIFEETGSQTLVNLGVAQTGQDNLSDILSANDIDKAHADLQDLALDYSKVRSAELVGMKYVDGELVENPNSYWSIEDSTRDALRGMISDAMEQGPSPYELAPLIEQLTTDSDTFSPSRADMIARTELNMAQNEGQWQAFNQASTLGLVYEKKWITSQDVPDDECSENADEGWIALDEVFPSGDLYPLAHPRCRCAIVTRTVLDNDDETQDESEAEKLAKFNPYHDEKR